MADESANLRREIEGFKHSTAILSDKINSVSDLWKDSNYAALQGQMGGLAKTSRTILESGEKTASSIDRFFSIAAEKV